MTRVSRDTEHFRRLYEASDDPWQFRTSAYEQAKYRRTIACLAGHRFRSGFEVGCSIGVLTRQLATQCDSLLAVDIVETPLAAAVATCADQPWVRFERMRVPDAWPAASFDLIVLSEVLYFLSPTDIASVADHVSATLTADGMVLLVNWRGRSGDPCTGDEAVRIFVDRTREWLQPREGFVRNTYRLDLLVRWRTDWPRCT